MSDKTTASVDTGAQGHFGARQVDPGRRQSLVNDVFDKVAGRYDLMNDVMSGGLHRLWKDAMVDWLAPPRSARSYRVLDVAGGTGDVALRVANVGGEGTQVTICDINPAMIAEGRGRTESQTSKLTHAAGNAEDLPFPDKSFDAYTIAFGIRNVTTIQNALDEAYRVLKPGGRFLCMEFSTVEMPGLDVLYDAYSNAAIPALGKAITGDGGALPVPGREHCAVSEPDPVPAHDRGRRLFPGQVPQSHRWRRCHPFGLAPLDTAAKTC